MTIEKAEEILAFHARQAVGMLPNDWLRPFHRNSLNSTQRIRESAGKGDWRQVINSIAGAGRSNSLSSELAFHVSEASVAIRVIDRLGTLRAIQHLTVEETKVFGECLKAAAHGPFFPDWEFHMLFGLERSRVADIASHWPAIIPQADDIGQAVNNSFNMLLSYPHKKWEMWSEFISVSPEQTMKVYERWRELTGRHLSKNTRARRHFDYFE